ncbi:MAG: 30S ribosomal protein S8 [Planctomycetota bacterium]|jgi:small subunit ribosomal protein S8|nr:30S ribosomal protein S8 [Planctomycetota bacterium]
MTMTDPIADMLTRIRNGIQVRRKSVDMPTSRMKSLIALTMKEEGYLSDVEVIDEGGASNTLRLHLKYDRDGNPSLQELVRVSKPGCRVYRDAANVPLVRRGLGTTIITTSKGIMSGRKARELGVGGEIICSLF